MYMRENPTREEEILRVWDAVIGLDRFHSHPAPSQIIIKKYCPLTFIKISCTLTNINGIKSIGKSKVTIWSVLGLGEGLWAMG